MKKIITILFLAAILIPFSVSFAQTNQQGSVDTSFFNIWKGTGGGGNATCNTLGYTCTFCDGLIVVVNIIKLLLNLGIILATVVILYAGVRFMTAGGSESQVSEAKEIIKKAVIGLALVAGAWFIVGMIFSFLTNRDNWNQINPLNCPTSKLKVWNQQGTGGKETGTGNENIGGQINTGNGNFEGEGGQFGGGGANGGW